MGIARVVVTQNKVRQYSHASVVISRPSKFGVLTMPDFSAEEDSNLLQCVQGKQEGSM
jgi:hypothetical protein